MTVLFLLVSQASPTVTELETSGDGNSLILDIAKVLSGGLFGSFATWAFTTWKNRMQHLYCVLMDEDVRSTIPVNLEGHEVQNFHYREFTLKNTCNRDISSMNIVFHFSLNSKILKVSTISKLGYDKLNVLPGKDPNETALQIEHFNRGDYVTFQFEIADIHDNSYNITEDKVTGVKILFKDGRKPKKPVKAEVVAKTSLSKR